MITMDAKKIFWDPVIPGLFKAEIGIVVENDKDSWFFQPTNRNQEFGPFYNSSDAKDFAESGRWVDFSEAQK